MSEDTASVEATEAVSDADAVAAAIAPSTETTNETETTTDDSRLDFVLDKYRTEGRSEQESLELQAKSYTELQSKFGSFTGPPDEYTLGVSEEMAEHGIEFESDDPMIEGFSQIAKDGGMNQEMFGKVLEHYAVVQLGKQQADVDYKASEMESLGDKAAQRINNIKDWASANMSEDMMEGLNDMTTSAASIQAVERLISMTSNNSITTNETRAAGAVSVEEVQAMQFEEDRHGNRRIATDKEFRARYEKAKNLAYGSGDHNIIVG